MIEFMDHREPLDAVATRLINDGFLRLRGLQDRRQVIAYGQSIGDLIRHRDSDEDGITTIERRPGALVKGHRGFSANALAPHTDGSGKSEPPPLLLLTCIRSSPTGGTCVIVDGSQVYSDLVASEPDAARALSAPRTALFGGAGGHLGSVFEQSPNGRLQIRYRSDDLIRFSPALARWLPALRTAIKRHAVRFSLEPGEGYLLDNHRWLHGRSAFTGDRVMYRVNLSPHARLAFQPGFTPQPNSPNTTS